MELSQLLLIIVLISILNPSFGHFEDRLGGYHSCAHSQIPTGGLKCWGANDGGQLGYETTVKVGALPKEMGDHLPYIYLGNLDVKQFATGLYHTIIATTTNKVKAWGGNTQGQLGYGDTYERGSTEKTMGKNLDYLNLGSEVEAWFCSGGKYFSCIVDLQYFLPKCWGANSYGQLGTGNNDNSGMGANEMGDYLLFIPLGENVNVEKGFVSGSYHNCALSQTNLVKCWGYNDNGQLGLGTDVDKGNHPNEMGDYLQFINLGTGVLVESMSASDHTTIVTVNHVLKSWGVNDDGELGYGNTQSLGLNPNEMGDYLPFVNIGTGLKIAAVFTGNHHTV